MLNWSWIKSLYKILYINIIYKTVLYIREVRGCLSFLLWLMRLWVLFTHLGCLNDALENFHLMKQIPPVLSKMTHQDHYTGMGEFNSDDHYIYYCGKESLWRNAVAIILNKRVWNAILGCNLKNDRMDSAHFQGKSFNITVIQVYALNSNAEEAEAEQFYEDLLDLVLDLLDLLELTPKKMSFSL